MLKLGGFTFKAGARKYALGLMRSGDNRLEMGLWS